MLGVFFIVLAGVLWAIDTLIRYPLLFKGTPAHSIVLFEHIYLTIIFLPLLFVGPFKLLKNQIKGIHLFYFFVIGVCGSAIGTLTFTEAFMLINPSIVILLQKLQPIVAISLAYFVLKESVQKSFLLWAFVALLGGFLISYPDIGPGLAQLQWSAELLNSKSLLGYGLTLIAVLSWGASTVFGKKLSLDGFSEIQIMGGRFLFGFIFMAIYVLSLKGTLHPSWEMKNYQLVLLMVFLSGLLGMYFYYLGLKKISARGAALAEMFFPMSAVIINWIFLNATLKPIQMIGGVILLIASIAIQKKRV